MLWLFFSLLAAIFETIKNLIAKSLTKKYDEYLLGFFSAIIISLVILPYVIFKGIPILGDFFFVALIVTGIINAITIVLILKALKITDLSLVLPMFALSPVLLLITSPFLIGEFPNIFGLIGIVFILIGTYVLNFKNKVNFSPFVEIFKNNGQRLIIFVTILWAVSSNFYKIGMQNSSPLFFIFSLNLFIALLLFPIVIGKKQFLMIRTDWKVLFPLGLFSALTSIFQWSAVSLNLIVYVLSIKRLSILFSIIFAYFLFKEKNTSQRIIATLIILFGVFLIALFN